MSRFHPRLDWASAIAQSGNDVLAHELQAERASALGIAGRRLERALAALAAAPGDQVDACMNEAGRLAWEFMVMREMAGLRDWPVVVRLYAIPKAVQRRMGMVTTLTRPDRS